MISGTRHHVPATRGHLVDGNRQTRSCRTQTIQLCGGQTVGVHQATTRVQSQYHLVLVGQHAFQRGDLLGEAFHSRRLDIADEVEHEHPTPGSGVLFLNII